MSPELPQQLGETIMAEAAESAEKSQVDARPLNAEAFSLDAETQVFTDDGSEYRVCIGYFGE